MFSMAKQKNILVLQFTHSRRLKKVLGGFFGRKGRKNHDIVLSSDNIMKILIKLTLLTLNGQAKGIPDICLELVPFIN